MTFLTLRAKHQSTTTVCVFVWLQSLTDKIQAVQQQLSSSIAEASQKLDKTSATAAATATATAIVQADVAALKDAQSKSQEKDQQAVAAVKQQVKAEVVEALEKKLHSALDAALITIKKEAMGDVTPLRRDFDELRSAIKRNAMWMLQTPA